MTIKDLINTVNFDSSIKNVDYNNSKYCSKENSDIFSRIFESANKSVNFSFDKTEKFSSKNTENNKFSSKNFKSEYETFYNKYDLNKNIDTSVRKEAVYDAKKAVSEAKEQRKEEISDAKKVVSEAKDQRKEAIKNTSDKDEKKEVLSETKETVSEAKDQKKEVIDNTNETVSEAKDDKKEIISGLNNKPDVPINENIDLNNLNISDENNIITDLSNPNLNLNQKTAAENTSNSTTAIQSNAAPADPLETLPEELTDIHKQIANEKITNKQAENVLQQQTDEIAEEIPDNQTAEAEEPIKDTATVLNQKQSEKPQFLASEDILNKLNVAEKNQVKLPQDENSKQASEKLAEAMKNNDAKPVITNVEINNTQTKTDADSQNQKQTQQEFKQIVNQPQSVSADDNTLQKIDIQKTSQFDKILNTKQTQNIENNILNQIKDKISSDITANKSQITIALRPDNLGKVSIDLISKDGVLTAQITAENNHVKDILTKGLEALRQNMAEQGINVGKLIVNVQEPNSSNNNLNPENNQKNSEQANSSDINYQSNKHNHSEESSSAYSNNELYEFDEEIENENEINETTGQDSAIHSGKVDYKV